LSFPRPFQLSLACFRVARSPSNSWASYLSFIVVCSIFIDIANLSVCLSVRLSHSWTMHIRFDLRSRFLHRMVAPWFEFSKAKFRLHILTVWPSNSRSNTSRVGKNVVFTFKTASMNVNTALQHWFDPYCLGTPVNNHAISPQHLYHQYSPWAKVFVADSIMRSSANFQTFFLREAERQPI